LPDSGQREQRITDRLARLLFPGALNRAVNAAISVRVDDTAGWTPLTQAGPHDRDFAEWLQDQTDALEAWRKNFLVRRLVALTRAYVLGGGLTLSSEHKWVDAFTQAFVAHNKLDTRYAQICDELTRASELFPVLFTNRVDGMSTVRFVPASNWFISHRFKGWPT
jgi:hypothetical protein